MNTDFEENDDNRKQPEKKDIDWLDYAAQNEEQSHRSLDRKDYIALFVASLQTIFLPLIVLILVFIAVNFWLQFMAGQI